jgi:hypothetical protein
LGSRADGTCAEGRGDQQGQQPHPGELELRMARMPDAARVEIDLQGVSNV